MQKNQEKICAFAAFNVILQRLQKRLADLNGSPRTQCYSVQDINV